MHMALVKVKNTRGEIQMIPDHWLGHPRFGQAFTPVKNTTSKKPTTVTVKAKTKKGEVINDA